MFRGLLLLSLLVFAFAAKPQFAQSFTVNSTADTPPWDDPNTPDVDERDDGICRDQNGQCSLRAAMWETNGGVTFPRTINIQVAGTISLTNQMPLFLYDGFKLIGNENVTIRQPQEGMSALGVVGNDVELQNVKIEAPMGSGLSISQGTNIKVQGCQITNCGMHGLTVAGGQDISIIDNVLSGNQISGLQIAGYSISGLQIKRNKIGTNAAGTQAMGNGMAGISIPTSFFPISGIVIGGDNPSDRNIISGNSNYGIQVLLNGVTIKNNYIGTSANGFSKLPNANAGITINSSDNIITKNVISGNSLYGIYLHSGGSISPRNNLITGNIIGGKASDTTALGNGIGIFVAGTASNNTIGSGVTQTNEANTIVYSTVSGIIISNSAGGPPNRNVFRKNIFHDNTIKAIEVKSGTQAGIAIPLLDSLSTDPGGITTLYGHGASPGAVVDLYKGATNTSGFSEGRTWKQQVNADGAGSFSFDVSSMGCDEMVVMQTDQQGNSSEFSNSMNPVPVSVSCTPQCSGPYIAGVFYSNEFTLKMNWRGMPSANRRITFALNGMNDLDGTISGDEVKVTYDMYQLHPGDNTLSWKIYKCDGSTINGPGLTLCATERPFWLLLPITATCNGGSVQYENDISFPDVVQNNVQHVPAYVDFIAGALKFLSPPKYSVKLKVPGQSPTFQFKSSFDILGFSMRLRASGHANLNHTCGSIFPSGTARLNGKFSQTFYAGYNVESFLPSCTGVLSWPVLQDGCDKLHSLARRLRVGAKVGGNFSLSGTVVLNNGLTLASGQGTLGLYVKPFLDVFFLHARGNGRIDLAVDLPSFSLTNFSGSLQGKIYSDFPLAILQFEKRLGPWTFGPDGPAPLSAAVQGSIGNTSAARDNDMEEPALFSLSDSLVVPNVAADADAVTATGLEGFHAAAWNTFSGTAARPAGDIALRLGLGTTWGNELPVTNDINIDRAPALAFDGLNKVVLCWERNTVGEIPPGADMYAPAYLKKFEIAYAVYNSFTGTLVQNGAFTDTSKYDAKPRLVRSKNGALLLTWQQTDGTTEFGKTSSPLTLKAVEWNGSVWGAVNTINSALTGVMSWEPAYYDTGKAMIALVRDTDNLLGTTNDLEVFSISRTNAQWQAPVRITNDNAVDWAAHCTYTNAGKPAMMWLRDSIIVGVHDNLLSTPRQWLDSAYHGIDFIDAKISCMKDTLIAAWSEAGAVYYSFADANNRVWSAPQAISITENIQKSVSLDNSDGMITLGFLEFPYADSIPTVGKHGKIYLSSVRFTQEPTSIKDEGSVIPEKYHLFETYPNPFNASMTVVFSTLTDSRVTIRVFDILGRERAILADGYFRPGSHKAAFNANDLPSGVYLVQFSNGQERIVKKVILSK